MAVEPARGIMMHRDPESGARGDAAVTRPEAWVSSNDVDGAAVLRRVDGEFDGWSPLLRSFVTGSNAEPRPRPIHALPVGIRWDRVPGVTLVGDAAHLMSPFAGEGANLALYDGADLAHELATAPDVESALAAYEDRLFSRSADVARLSAQNLETFFAPGAPGSVVALFDRS